MKKLALSICGAVLAFGVNAEENAITAKAHPCFEGLYTCLGGAVSKAGVKTETTQVLINGIEINAAEGIDTNDHDIMFFGTFIFGYNARLDDRVHLAFEGGLDFGPSSNFDHAGVQPAEDCLMNVTSRQNGLIPFVGLKLGYLPLAWTNMLYLKVGVALPCVKTRYTEERCEYEQPPALAETTFPPVCNTIRCSKLAPLVAIGIEKPCQNDFRTRFEIEYRFSTNDKLSYQILSTQPAGSVCNKTIRVSSKGAITLRAMAVFPL